MAYTYEYPRPAFTVDALVFDPVSEQVLLIQRAKDPFANEWALPGGFVDMDETPEHAVRRELLEETCLDIEGFEQMHTFGAVDRDPRHRTISTVFVCIQEGVSKHEVKGADDARAAAWYDLEDLPKLAFDHSEVIEFFKKKYR
jgi:8-oxo-dGTP diphosphatase